MGGCGFYASENSTLLHESAVVEKPEGLPLLLLEYHQLQQGLEARVQDADPGHAKRIQHAYIQENGDVQRQKNRRTFHAILSEE